MLDEPSGNDVVRWGKAGDTFVVVEGERFNSYILPKHFRHRNMSSFVRQLNKYGFHKVNSPRDWPSISSGNRISEFKHPCFRLGEKGDWHKIVRKVPRSKRLATSNELIRPRHIAEQLTATQREAQKLVQMYADVAQTNKLLLEKTSALRKMLNAQAQAQHEILKCLTHLHTMDEVTIQLEVLDGRRETRHRPS